MSTTKLFNPGRQLLRLNSLRAAGSRALISTSPANHTKHLRLWRPFDDQFFNMASRLMRNLEREFDWMSRPTSNQWFPALEKSLQQQQQSAWKDLVVTDKDGNRKFQLVLELGDFKPEEIKVKTHGHTLNISAKKESKGADEYYLREFTQSYSLPKELKLEDLKSKWTDEGCLIIDAPLPKQLESTEKPNVKEIPIEHSGGHAKSIEDKNNKK